MVQNFRSHHISIEDIKNVVLLQVGKRALDCIEQAVIHVPELTLFDNDTSITAWIHSICAWYVSILTLTCLDTTKSLLIKEFFTLLFFRV